MRRGWMASHRARIRVAWSLVVALVLVLAGCGTGSSGGSSGAIQIWEGYTGAEAKAFAHLLAQYHRQHPGVQVTSLFVNNDNTLQKVLTAVRGGSPPDIAYLYGSWAPNVAQIPQVVTLTKVVAKPSVNWNDFWVGERDVATVNGRVIGIPALVDNLAVVYNKKLFAKAGLTDPSPDWTWAQFQADAKKLTDPAIKQFGTAYVTPGTEDTVWHWEALLWEAGGQLLTPDNKKAAFDSKAGLTSLTTLRDHGGHRQVDVPGPDRLGLRQPVQLRQDRHAGHRAVGPVGVPERELRRAGHAVLPRHRRRPSDHLRARQLGDLQQRQQPGRRGREVPALADRAGSGQVLLADAPATCRSGARWPSSPGFNQQMDTALPDVSTFISNLNNVNQARPQIPQYPEDLADPRQHDRVGAAGQEPAAGRADSAAQQVNQALARLTDVSAATARGRGARRQPRPGRAPGARSEQFTGWAFVTPGVAIILLFGAAPIVWSAIMSFQQNNLLTAEHAVRRPAQLPADGARPGRRLGHPAHAHLHRAVRAGHDARRPVPGRGHEPEDPLHLVLPDRRLRDDGDLHDQRGAGLHLAVRPVLRHRQLRLQPGRHPAAAVPQLPVRGAVRDRGR